MRFLRRRVAGHREPRDVLNRHIRATVAALVAAIAVSACAKGDTLDLTTGDLGRPILLVSGRDDHGLLAADAVDVLDEPGGRLIGQIPDDTLVQVLGEDNEWIEVRTLEGREVEGWVNDFHLRRRVHLVGQPAACDVGVHGVIAGPAVEVWEASALVELVDVHGPDADWLGVRRVRDGALALVPRPLVRELSGPAPRPGVACEDIPVDETAERHTH